MAADEGSSALLTDLYQLTMLQAYFDRGMHDRPASFELFSRKLPPGRNFLLAAGLEQVLQWLVALRFQPAELDWLRRGGRFSADFLRWLGDLRFTGDVWAMPEGTAFFPDEPVLRISAPMAQAQLVESRVLNLVHFQTVVASKAARCVLAAPGKLLVDFGLRRAHGAEAGLLSARASYLAGFDGTATALAGLRFGIPVFGTMAHSFVQAHDDEALAFEHFARSQPRHATLLIDTYDTEAAARKVVALARRLAADGIAVQGVRLDSGDLAQHAQRVRGILDAGGLAKATIFASGNLDEHRLAALLAAGAPIDGFGVGTRMNTSADAPYLDCAYKLVAYEGRPRRKRSEGKATWPGCKQVWRLLGADGRFAGDVLGLQEEVQDGTALLEPVMLRGRRTGGHGTLAAARDRARAQLDALPAALRGLESAPPYPVAITPALRAAAARLDATAPGGQATASDAAAQAGPRAGDALIVVDVQNDFLPGGALAVPRGDEVLPVLAEAMRRFEAAGLPVFASRDWHGPRHGSFQAQGGPWPPHCVADTPGAAFAAALVLPAHAGVVSKGLEDDDPGYSAFAHTDLERRLRALGVARVFVGGLATDYCVLHTVRDALALGFAAVLLEDAVRAVDASPGDGAAALEQMRSLGAQVVRGACG